MVDIGKTKKNNNKVIKEFNRYLNENSGDDEKMKIIKRLKEGFAVKIYSEYMEDFLEVLEEYGDFIDYKKDWMLNREDIPNNVYYFVLIGNKLFHTTSDSFGGEKFDVYLPSFKWAY